MFETAQFNKKEPRRRKSMVLVFVFAFLFHIVSFSLMAVLPLSKVKDFPQLIVTEDVILKKIPSPPPPPPPPPQGNKNYKSQKKEPRKEPKKQEVKVNKNIVPLDPPEDIVDKEMPVREQEGVEWGVEGGIPTGENLLSESFMSLFSQSETKSSEPKLLVKPPRVLRRVIPIYPQEARITRVTGVVILNCETDIYGRVVKVKALKGHPFLVRAAIKAVKQWLFEPTVVNGKPRPVKFTLTVHFRFK